jgi:hypothetical protein
VNGHLIILHFRRRSGLAGVRALGLVESCVRAQRWESLAFDPHPAGAAVMLTVTRPRASGQPA